MIRRGEGGRTGMDGQFGVLDANCYIWNGWAVGPYCTAQGTVCDWVPSLYNRNWRKIVHQLYFNKNNEIILKIKNGIRERMH